MKCERCNQLVGYECVYYHEHEGYLCKSCYKGWLKIADVRCPSCYQQWLEINESKLKDKVK